MTTEPFYNPPLKPNILTVDSPRDRQGNTYLHELCARNAPLVLIREAVEQLGANVDALNQLDLTPLGTAIVYAAPEVVECLIDLGASLYLPSPHENRFFNAAFLAVTEGKSAALEKIIAHHGGFYLNATGVDANGRDMRLHALHAAINKEHYNLIAPLVAAGAFANGGAGFQNETPLFTAIEKNSAHAVKKLIEAGAGLEQRAGAQNLTPLLQAITQTRSMAAKALLDAGADVDARNNAGETPLMLAAERGDAYMTRLLLDAGADPNLRGGTGNEPALLVAARRNFLNVVEILLKEGADPLLTDSFNRTALQIVPSHDRFGLHDTLEAAENRALQKHFEKSYKKYRP